MNEHSRFYLIAIVDVGSPVFDQFYQSILCPIILLSSPFVQPPGQLVLNSNTKDEDTSRCVSVYSINNGVILSFEGLEFVKHFQLFVYNSIGMVDYTCNSQHIGCGWVWHWNNCGGVRFSKGSDLIILCQGPYIWSCGLFLPDRYFQRLFSCLVSCNFSDRRMELAKFLRNEWASLNFMGCLRLWVTNIGDIPGIYKIRLERN